MSELTEVTGPYGTANRVPRANYEQDSPAALDSWIITAPLWHPLWSQYRLLVITLAEVPGVPSATKHRPDVTHELMVLTLDPGHGPVQADQVRKGSLRYLTPGNVDEQFTTTDDKAVKLAELCVRAVVDGGLCPEAANAPDRIRAAWRQAIHQTLAHDRDPHHGRAN
ncbi:hypothetical protein Ssi03_62240 [Sphaerisporangium siamense]|uniref:Uncharacterized protein n=1 Tax=Sphaerisporangium siamense TaxID=795645 RepID=A0A7W7GB85_9ACTN|nr:hypothetical protein [Sphaerisporangium siamense]MBB4702535.1 hypothetical protein [Sphaerisporangium siamense]GII88234.1 hypothetical protein Ssi03_62240 [Sphaerisporangium siamense]